MRWFLALCIVAACHGGGGGGGNAQRQLKPSLDLTGVIGFAIANGSSPRISTAPATGPDAGTCMPATLFALQANGDMTVTTVLETTSKDMGTQCEVNASTEMATAVFDAAKYTVITYSPALENCAMPGTGGMCPQCPSTSATTRSSGST